MKRLLMAALAAACLTAGPALADLTITTGSPSGSYYDFGNNLASALHSAGHDATVVESQGSAMNIARVVRGEADIAFTQADSLMASGQANSVRILGPLGQECIFVAGRVGVVDDEDDLEGARVAAGYDGSGSADSLLYAQQLEDDYRSIQPVYIGDFEALAALKSGEVDAFLWVTAPGKLDHDYLTVVRQSEDLHVIDFNDYDMNDELPSGEAVYTFQDVVIEEGMVMDTAVETACTDILVIASKDLDSSVSREVSRQLLLNPARIRGGV